MSSKEIAYVENPQAFADALAKQERYIEYIMNSRLKVLFGIDYEKAKVLCHDFINRRPVINNLKEPLRI